MQTYSIPIVDRERYLRGQDRVTAMRDSTGNVKILCPLTFDVPVDLLVHLEDGRLEWVELNYLSEHGMTVEHVLGDIGSFSVFLYHGLVSVIRPRPQPRLIEAYDRVEAFAERLAETARFQSDLAPGKWKTIFSAHFLREQWKTGEPFLRRLLASDPHPYR